MASTIIKSHVSDAWKMLLASEIEEVTPSSTGTTDVLLTVYIELYSRVRFKRSILRKRKKEQLQKAKSLNEKVQYKRQCPGPPKSEIILISSSLRR